MKIFLTFLRRSPPLILSDVNKFDRLTTCRGQHVIGRRTTRGAFWEITGCSTINRVYGREQRACLAPSAGDYRRTALTGDSVRLVLRTGNDCNNSHVCCRSTKGRMKSERLHTTRRLEPSRVDMPLDCLPILRCLIPSAHCSRDSATSHPPLLSGGGGGRRRSGAWRELITNESAKRRLCKPPKSGVYEMSPGNTCNKRRRTSSTS
jgi:hypothetical protein